MKCNGSRDVACRAGLSFIEGGFRTSSASPLSRMRTAAALVDLDVVVTGTRENSRWRRSMGWVSDQGTE